MQDLPHHYTVAVAGAVDGDIELTSAGLPYMVSASPAEFGGPGDRWSPETLLVGAVADCFLLTFRAVARASKLPWTSLRCDVTGTLDRGERAMQFTHFDLHAAVTVPAGVDADQIRHLLDKAERGCLITNSLKAEVRLTTDIQVSANPDGALAGV
jgi:organic hydroperoxide reductase OsmC/OhrA